MFPWLRALNMLLSSWLIDLWRLFGCMTGSIDVFHYLPTIRLFSFLNFAPFLPLQHCPREKFQFYQNQNYKEPNKITQQLLAVQTLRSRVFYRPTQWQCRKEKLSGFLCELVGWLYFRIRKTAVRLSKVTVRAHVFTEKKEREKETNRENMQRNCLKNRCFMTEHSNPEEKELWQGITWAWKVFSIFPITAIVLLNWCWQTTLLQPFRYRGSMSY